MSFSSCFFLLMLAFTPKEAVLNCLPEFVFEGIGSNIKSSDGYV